MRSFRTALVQMDSRENQERNLKEMEQRVSEAAANGARLVVFPETADYIGEDFRGHAADVPGWLTRRLARIAGEYGIWLHAGSVTERYPGRGSAGKAVEKDKTGDSKLRNLSMLFSPAGELCAAYRKLHLFDVEVENGPSYRESDEITAGEELTVADTELGRIGMSVCYDLRFPEMFRKMTLEGAEILIVSANFTDATGRAHWEPLLRARAIENMCYVLACGQCGEKKSFRAHGHSMIISPWGEILSEAGTQPEIIYADLDGEYLYSCRRQIPCLNNRRPDIYG